MSTRRFKKLMELYKNMIFSQAYYFTGNYDDAADVTQEVFMKLWSKHDSLSDKKVKSWLLKVTRNQCIDHYRMRKRQGITQCFDEAENLNGAALICGRNSDPEHHLMRNDMKKQLTRAISKLPPKIKTVIILREIHQEKYEEIARLLNVSLNSVKVNLHRGRKMLYCLLGQQFSERENTSEQKIFNPSKKVSNQ